MAKSEKRRRTVYISGRVTPEEKEQFLARCVRSGLSTGDYIRRVCLDMKPLRAVRNVSVDKKLLTEAINQMARYGNNLNQVVRKLNQGRRLKRVDERQIQAALEQLRLLRQLYRKALGYDS